jgi:fatty-acyl-CoA synthase
MAGAAKVTVAGVAERREALERRHGPWQERSLAALLDDVAAQHPDRPFVITDDGSWTYRELADWSRAIARGLVDRGVEPGEHVAVVLPNGPETIAVKFAIARAGAVAVPVNILLKAEELGYVLGQSRSVALVTTEEFRGIDALETLDRVTPGWDSGRASEQLPEIRLVVTVPRGSSRDGRAPAGRRAGVLHLAGLAHEPDVQLDAELDRRTAAVTSGDTASIFYTSGTTGPAKGVISTHDMELRSAYGSAYTRAFEDGRRILFALPLHHVFAYVEGLLASMFVAGGAVVQAAFDPKATLEAVAKHRANEALFVPTMSLAIVEAARGGGYELSSLHSVMSAAAPAPARLWRDLNEVLGVEQLVTAYGMTETAAATTFTMPGDPIEYLVGTVGRPKLGGVAGDREPGAEPGRGLDGGLDGGLSEYRTVDPTGVLLPAGQEGELVARGPIVTPGYFDKPRETAEARLPGGWLRSGDLGIVREDGYLVLTGRSKELYKCGAEPGCGAGGG